MAKPIKVGDYITSIDEANSAPRGTLIVNGYGHAIQKGGDGHWYYDVNDANEIGPLPLEPLFKYGMRRLVVWVDGTGGVWFEDGR